MPEQSDRSVQEGDHQNAEDHGGPVDESGRKSGQVSLRGIASLERLRDRVEAAAHEMTRLRKENEMLIERIKNLETRPVVDPTGTFLTLDHDPEVLKRKISGFIDALDHFLERERTNP